MPFFFLIWARRFFSRVVFQCSAFRPPPRARAPPPPFSACAYFFLPDDCGASLSFFLDMVARLLSVGNILLSFLYFFFLSGCFTIRVFSLPAAAPRSFRFLSLNACFMRRFFSFLFLWSVFFFGQQESAFFFYWILEIFLQMVARGSLSPWFSPLPSSPLRIKLLGPPRKQVEALPSAACRDFPSFSFFGVVSAFSFLPLRHVRLAFFRLGAKLPSKARVSRTLPSPFLLLPLLIVVGDGVFSTRLKSSFFSLLSYFPFPPPFPFPCRP